MTSDHAPIANDCPPGACDECDRWRAVTSLSAAIDARARETGRANTQMVIMAIMTYLECVERVDAQIAAMMYNDIMKQAAEWAQHQPAEDEAVH
jgi:hypothetical protein